MAQVIGGTWVVASTPMPKDSYSGGCLRLVQPSGEFVEGSSAAMSILGGVTSFH